jgi:hypothetical protein
VSVDPDSELIVSTTVAAGNAGDASAAPGLLAADLPEQADQAERADERIAPAPVSVYGDSAYGSGELLDTLERADAEIYCKVQAPNAPGGRFAKSEFRIDLDAGTVVCPAGHAVGMTPVKSGRIARFAGLCAGCPLAERCTASPSGRTIHVGNYERQLARARARQADPAWTQDYKQTRPKVERKIAHLTRRKHGGRRARVRGKPKVSADFALLAAAVNLTRLAVLGLAGQGSGWRANIA